MILAALGCVGLVGWRVWETKNHQAIPKLPTLVTNKSTVQPESSKSAAFNKNQYPIDQPGSLWWIVNKKRPLTKGYKPEQLVVPNVSLRLSAGSEQMKLDKRVAEALPAMFKAAQSAGLPLTMASGYRSEAYQAQLYNSYVVKDGQAAADRYSAKPGTSEHQTGLALDVCASNSSCALEQSIGQTATGQWIASHAHEYGFIVRYLEGKESVTGYQYEPWHLRFVGVELAAQLHKSGQTMEEFFGL